MADKDTKKPKGGKPPAAKDAGKAAKTTSKKVEPFKGEASKPVPKGYVPRVQKLYKEQAIPAMMTRFEFKNVMLMPRLDKVVLNIGVGDLHSDQKFSESLQEELRLISGMKPVLTKAKKSISNFKLRQGMVVGIRVTLRGNRMYEFIDRLVSVVIPRIRDFRGLSDRSFDGKGNYNFGIKEQIIFPEIDYDKVVKIHGMDICVVTTAPNDEQALELLRALGFPFRRRVEGKEAA